jgi:hypothetical protein
MLTGISKDTGGLEINGTQQLWFYGDDFNLLGEKINIMKKNIKALLHASKEVGLELSSEKTKFTFVLKNQKSIHKELKTIFRECFQPCSLEYFVFQTLPKHVQIKVYKTIILLVVLYGSEISSLTLRQKQRLRMTEKYCA